MTISGTAADGRFGIRVAPEAVDALIRYCEDGMPDETGGVLIGYYTADASTAVVTEVTPPPRDSRRGRTWFERGVHGLKAMMESLWNRDEAERRHYLGEWHLHPFGPLQPSRCDQDQMESLSRGSQSCREPLLLIVGGDPAGWEIGVWVFPRGEAAMELVRTPTTRGGG